MSPPEIKKPILSVHDTTLQHLTEFEKLVLNEMVTAGQAVIVSEMPGQPDVQRRGNGKHTVTA